MKRMGITLVAAFCAVAVLCVYVFAAPPDRDENSPRVLTKFQFIHYRRGPAKPPAPPGGGKKEDQGGYTYIAKGARWKTVEPFVLNPTNGDAVPQSLLENATALGIAEWEKYGGNIFGSLAVDTSVSYDDSAPDGLNALSFGSYGDSRVIAITTVWGYFGGPPSQREIIEADILFNELYLWGDADVNSVVMDFQNIATHELGHCAGMGDLYNSGDSLETMYGYSTEGEILKRDLYKGDITGITKLYQ
ncbi:MAG: matrixin family metalloprotease [Planctomycetota bacterium]